MAIRSSHLGVMGVLLALTACGQTTAGDQSASISNTGGVLFAVSETCSPGAGGGCELVGNEHVLVSPQDFARAGVATAAPAGDGTSAVDVLFDSEGAAAFSKASKAVAQNGDRARLLLRVDEQVLSAVRVPSPAEVTKMRIVLPKHLDAQDVALRISRS